MEAALTELPIGLGPYLALSNISKAAFHNCSLLKCVVLCLIVGIRTKQTTSNISQWFQTTGTVEMFQPAIQKSIFFFLSFSPPKHWWHNSFSGVTWKYKVCKFARICGYQECFVAWSDSQNLCNVSEIDSGRWAKLWLTSWWPGAA